MLFYKTILNCKLQTSTLSYDSLEFRERLVSNGNADGNNSEYIGIEYIYYSLQL